MVRYFYEHFDEICQYNDLYTHWLIDFLRRRNTVDIQGLALITTSLKKEQFNSIEDEDQANFSKMLTHNILSSNNMIVAKNIMSQTYYIAQLKLTQFMGFANIPTDQNYQLTKLRECFETRQYQTLPIKVFAEDYFQSVATFPLYKKQFLILPRYN